VSLGGEAAAGLAVLVAFAVSAAGAALCVRAGPVDPPGARTLHAAPTPTSGGVAMPAAVALALLLDWLLTGRPRALVGDGWALIFAGLTGLIGALDDMFDLNAKAKLMLSVLLAGGFAWLVGPLQQLPLGLGVEGLPLWPVIGLAGAALWIVTVTNAVNFMDGANGLAPGALAVSFATLAAAAFGHGAGEIGVAAACAAAACAGFLPFNLRGRLFQGDAGSLFAAFFFAALCLAAAGRDGLGPVGLYFGPIALMPFLADVLLTLLARARAGKSLLSAHREHLYQRWLQATGESHGALAWRAALVMAAFGALAAGASFAPQAVQTAMLVVAAAAATLGWKLAGRGLV
jgi:UDP-N-acetylmuramyl pentapeptide phosphotransferase/UDP-N-acetylglucosamine-1-phosphate transferase